MGWLGQVSTNPLPGYLCKNEEAYLRACNPRKSTRVMVEYSEQNAIRGSRDRCELQPETVEREGTRDQLSQIVSEVKNDYKK